MSDADWLIRVGRALIKDGVWNDAFRSSRATRQPC